MEAPYEATLKVPVDEKFYDKFANLLWASGSDLAKKTLADDYIMRMMRNPDFAKFASKALAKAFATLCKEVVSNKSEANAKFIKARTEAVSNEVREKATKQIEAFVEDAEKIVATVEKQLTESMANDIKIRFEKSINASMIALENQLITRIKQVAADAHADWLNRIDSEVQKKVEDVINNQLDDYIKQRAAHRVNMRVDNHPKLQKTNDPTGQE